MLFRSSSTGVEICVTGTEDEPILSGVVAWHELASGGDVVRGELTGVAVAAASIRSWGDDVDVASIGKLGRFFFRELDGPYALIESLLLRVEPECEETAS